MVSFDRLHVVADGGCTHGTLIFFVVRDCVSRSGAWALALGTASAWLDRCSPAPIVGQRRKFWLVEVTTQGGVEGTATGGRSMAAVSRLVVTRCCGNAGHASTTENAVVIDSQIGGLNRFDQGLSTPVHLKSNGKRPAIDHGCRSGSMARWRSELNCR